LKNISFSNFII